MCMFECLRLRYGRAKDVETCDKRVSAPSHTHAVASTCKREPRQTQVFARSARYIGLKRKRDSSARAISLAPLSFFPMLPFHSRAHPSLLSLLLTVAHSLTLCACVLPPDGKRNLGGHLPGW